MTAVTVTTQTELDAAFADDATDEILIRSDRGVWLEIGTTGDKDVRASGSASVSAFGSASVRASGSATVSASGSASVRASGSASVNARGSASVSAFDWASVRAFDSASVRASGSASVRASDSASVRASGSATVSAFDSASVSAFGSASVSAFGSASVSAFDSASVSAFDWATVSASGWASVRASGWASVRASDSASVHGHGSSTVNATSHVAVHLHSGSCRVEGGVLIDHTTVDQSEPATWCSYHGAIVSGDHAFLYKAVRQDWRSTNGTSYEPGTTASCEDFRADGNCGGGLHVSQTPAQAGAYDSKATRYVEVRVPLVGINVIGPDKVKAEAVECIREVDIHGNPIQGAGDAK